MCTARISVSLLIQVSPQPRLVQPFWASARTLLLLLLLQFLTMSLLLSYCLVPDLPLCCRAEAGKVELDGASYAGFDLPFSITQLVWIEAILVGGAEIYRNGELNPEKRLYPGVC